MKPDIDIISPKCSKKAAFYSQTVIRNTRIVPDINGQVICSSCGLNKNFQFSSNDYYYAIPIGNKFLYARTLDKLKDLLMYFKKDKRLNGNPELDFPKEFYKKRLEIVTKIEKRINEEIKTINNSKTFKN